MLKGRNILLYLVKKYNSDFDTIISAIRNKEDVIEEEVEKVVFSTKTKFITLLDAEYPTKLKSCFRPPFCLFCLGNTSLLNDRTKKIGVIAYSETLTTEKTMKRVIGGLNSDLVIITTLDDYVCREALKDALDKGLKTILVVNKGLDQLSSFDEEARGLCCMVLENNGLIISEFADGCVEMKKADKEIRKPYSLLISDLASILLVGEVSKVNNDKMNAHILYAEEKNNEICVIPTNPENGKSYNNNLIADGAVLVDDSNYINNFVRELVEESKEDEEMDM